MTGVSHRSGEIARHKREAERGLGERLACEVCGWTLPAGIGSSPVHLHHVVPVAAGGAAGDLIALCPNHHAVAHALWPLRGARGETKRYVGPRTPDEAVEELRLFDAAPGEYALNRARIFVDSREEALAAMRRVLPDYQPPPGT